MLHLLRFGHKPGDNGVILYLVVLTFIAAVLFDGISLALKRLLDFKNPAQTNKIPKVLLQIVKQWSEVIKCL